METDPRHLQSMNIQIVAKNIIAVLNKVPPNYTFFKEEWERLLVVEDRLRIGNESDCYTLTPEWYQKLRKAFEEVMLAGISDNVRTFLDRLLFSNTIDDEYSHTDEHFNFANLFVKDKEYQPNEVVLSLRALYRTYYYESNAAERPNSNVNEMRTGKPQQNFTCMLHHSNKEALMGKLHELIDGKKCKTVAVTIKALMDLSYLAGYDSKNDLYAAMREEFKFSCTNSGLNKFLNSNTNSLTETDIKQIKKYYKPLTNCLVDNYQKKCNNLYCTFFVFSCFYSSLVVREYRGAKIISYQLNKVQFCSVKLKE